MRSQKIMPIPYRLMNDRRVEISYAFWGVDRPRVISDLMGMLDECAARPKAFDFSTNYKSVPTYNGNIRALVYPDQADALRKMFSDYWDNETSAVKRLLERRPEFFNVNHEEQWVYRFQGILASYDEGMKQFTDHLKDHGVQLARICASVCQVGTGYGLKIEGTFRASMLHLDQDDILDCMRLLQRGAVKSMISINFTVDSPMSLEHSTLP